MKLSAPLTASVILFASTLAADTAPENAPVHETTPSYGDLFNSSAFTVVTENDKYFAGTDQHYTNGLKLSFLGTTRLEESPGFIQAVTKYIPSLRKDASRQHYKAGVSLGQNIYTPGDTDATVPDPNDRPYAGWLYTSLDLQAKSLDGKMLRMVEIAIGMVGPAALGEQAQNTIHNWMDIPEANGWDYQLKNEPGIILSWERRHRLLRFDLGSENGFSTDLIGRYGVSLGNIRTNAAAGLGMRLGWRLPQDFGADLIRPSGGDETPVSQTSVYFFASSDARAVARNIFLDGNTWKDSPSVDKEPFVADLNVGLVFRFSVHLGSIRGLQLAYIQNYRTKEFEGQSQGDVFGSISVTALF